MTSAEPGPADHHLGESLAALVDGELSHDTRDRVLAHLATCPSCKAEADAQRELKSVFAESPPPGPSDGLLARLQGLPASDGGLPSGPGTRTPPDPPAPRGGGTAFRLDLLPGGKGRESLLGPPRLGSERGFRIHDGGGPRLHRGRRLAFAAAGAVSLAAVAIGGAVTSAGSGVAAPGSGGSEAAAAGATVTQAAAARSSGARSQEEEAGGTGGLTAHTVGLSLLSAPAGPIGATSQLFPLLNDELRPSPAVGPVEPPSSGAGTAGAVSPR
ncbi:anti-sigma factor family protein [Streptomyces radicis]|uniref:Zf-HC2 domain-containing protein n=1 Tax=Streptomyces radicis TaxID=1750517 RepID=A0A3A9WMR7_9ACTN|nr:zf-HC2 domain-containing protein [Streptomyces radicis]RKN09036.1 zf-HC2 domain-containing protein [Streptomyces radicis]RKN22773.1 zf-HC2 domain-containing protein [Streptomyces radicis]